MIQHYTLYIIYNTQYTRYYTIYNVHYTLYIIHLKQLIILQNNIHFWKLFLTTVNGRCSINYFFILTRKATPLMTSVLAYSFFFFTFVRNLRICTLNIPLGYPRSKVCRGMFYWHALIDWRQPVQWDKKILTTIN